jgi:hypothetical protein
MFRSTILLAFFQLFYLQTQAQSAVSVTGDYYLQGVMETASISG